jgi:hypothetical protein
MNPAKFAIKAFLVISLLLLANNNVCAQGVWKLIWYDHFSNGFFEVVRTDVSLADVENRLFHTWCIPFDRTRYEILEEVVVAQGEHWQVEGRNQYLAERGLPPLNERWFQIMDDERWYAYRVRPR